MTKQEITSKLYAIAHTEQELGCTTPEERDAMYKALVVEILASEDK